VSGMYVCMYMVRAAFAVVSTYQPALGPRGVLWPVSLCVIHKEGLCHSSRCINRLKEINSNFAELGAAAGARESQSIQLGQFGDMANDCYQYHKAISLNVTVWDISSEVTAAAAPGKGTV
jgi:hypothetical protein